MYKIFKFKLYFLSVIIFIFSCAKVPYEYGSNIEGKYTLLLREGEPQIERGKPVPVLDGIGHYFFSLPSKIILWNWRVCNHKITEETEQKIKQYLEDNDLHNVKVRLNQYEPRAEWRRLARNRDMPGFWRFTFGTLSLVYYTVFPERLFAGFIGGDHYNPYTNTINIYSDHKSIGLHEAGHSKDFAPKPRAFKGWYAFLYGLPGIALYHEAIATGDAIGYNIAKELILDQKADYKILYPAYATYIAGAGLDYAAIFMPISAAIQYGAMFTASIVGNVTGRIKAARID